MGYDYEDEIERSGGDRPARNNGYEDKKAVSGERAAAGNGRRPGGGSGERATARNGGRPEGGSGERATAGSGGRPGNGSGNRATAGNGGRPEGGSGGRATARNGGRPGGDSGNRATARNGGRPEGVSGKRAADGSGGRPEGGSGGRTTARDTARQMRVEKSKRRKRIIKVIIAEVFALVFIFCYAFVYKYYSAPQRLEFKEKDIKNEELTVEDFKKMKGYWMIAIFGVDSRGSNVGKGTNADISMIACINQDTGDVKLVSVFRDTYLNIDDKNTYNKINAAYAAGGPNQAVKALNKNLDLNITDYITFNWKGVADAINILGGVDVEITKKEFKQINGFITKTVEATGIGSNHLKKSGMNHLDGVQAVAYGRLRLMDTDFARTERQRKIIELAFEKAKKADYSVLNNIIVVVLPQVATSLDFGDLTNVALNITKYKLGETGGFPFARDDATMGKKGRCVIPRTLESNVVQLHQFLFGDDGYVTTDAVKKISAKIASDTGMYSKAQAQTGSAIPKDKDEPETSSSAEQSDTAGQSSSAWETDEFGDIIMPTQKPTETDALGNPIPSFSTNESSSMYPGMNESSGNYPGDATMPVGTDGWLEPTNPTSSTDTEVPNGPGVPGASQPTDTRPVGPSVENPSSAVPRPGDESSSAGLPGGDPSGGFSEGSPGGSPGGGTPGGSPGGGTPGGSPGGGTPGGSPGGGSPGSNPGGGTPGGSPGGGSPGGSPGGGPLVGDQGPSGW